MCGLGGVMYFDRRPLNLRSLKRLADAMRARGPDDDGFFVAPGIGLVHRRLRIIDLSSSGNCPMGNEDGSIQLVHNGEIYNFCDLRDKLSRKGHRFVSRSDTEVIIHGYEEWGCEVISALNGMFAFALWDAHKEILLLARDRIGEKPLYYTHLPEGVFFASSLPAINDYLELKHNLDPLGLVRFLSYGYIPGPETAWEKIKQLEPAHYMTIHRTGRTHIEQYWDFPESEVIKLGLREAEICIEHKLEASVRDRLIADVPIGGFLSGGVDSSLVMALAAKHKSQIHTFSIGYKEEEFSELPYARQVAKVIGSNHHELIVRDDDLFAVLPQLIWHHGQPYGDSSNIPTYLVSQFAREKVKVCLSGDGGDESFGGYRRAMIAWYASVWAKTLPTFARRSFVPKICALIKNMSLASALMDRFNRLNELSLCNSVLVHHNTLSWFDHLDDISGDYLTEVIQKENQNRNHWKDPGNDGQSNNTLLRQVLLHDYKVQLPYDFLVKVDVASMAASLEVRTPFLEHHFIDTAWRLSDDLKIRFGSGKWLLKRIAARHVPRSVIYREKRGFAMPMREWWKGPLQKILKELMSDSRAVRWGWIRAHPVHKALDEHATGLRMHDTRLWLILCLELWGRIVLERSMKRETSLLELTL